MIETFDNVRATKRVPARLAVTVEKQSARISGLCVDLSAGGVGLRAKPLPENGETVAVRIIMPSGRVIEADAVVMHSGEATPRRCGLRFQRLEPTSLFAIHRYVARGGAAA